ncbi:MAG: hypothetical protein JW774_02145 [Candidatus Aureabacteria bacterium]|nr:hypothetical protein [Candidatus Auribacterota bacterium]
MTLSSTPNNRRRFMLGVGLDNEDGHKRITKGKDFTLIGGSKETHEEMQEKSIKLVEKLKKKGKTIGDVNDEEFIETAEDIGINLFPDPKPPPKMP